MDVRTVISNFLNVYFTISQCFYDSIGIKSYQVRKSFLNNIYIKTSQNIF